MHRCNPDDQTPCNAWCHGMTHVDVAYCGPALLAALPPVQLAVFMMVHARRHQQEYHTSPCTILALNPAPEAPTMPQRYPEYGLLDELAAFRVTYTVEKRT